MTHSFSQSALSHLTPADRVLFERFGKGPEQAAAFSLVHRAFEAHAAAQPDAVAIEHLDETITYGELDRRANALAALLREHGVVPGDRVALFVQRSIPMVVGLLATLKVGAAYVPQHVGVAPDAQLRHVIATAGTRVILTLSSVRHLVPVPAGHTCIEIDRVPATSAVASRLQLDGSLACFVLFTSGTTGAPNGVAITHRNVCNILHTAPGNLGMGPGLRVSQILSIAFDMAAWEILGCLGHGGTLLIRGRSIEDTVARADIVVATPSILGTLDADRCRHVRVVAVAGEPCPRPLADRWSAFAQFYNGCGPTEVTIVNTLQHYTRFSERLTIGSPTPNNTVYILDEDLRALPIGDVGEMWAGGDCVSAGYLANDALNAERYRADPFLGGRRMMFRTRDLGRWTPDGQLEHLGRTDDQVKVRGFRVELDSVSRVLETTRDCRQAATLKLDDRHLIGFVTPRSVDVDAARAHVAARLPYYCVPEFILALDELPQTSRGKIDKRALLDIAHAVTAQPAVAAGGRR